MRIRGKQGSKALFLLRTFCWPLLSFFFFLSNHMETTLSLSLCNRDGSVGHRLLIQNQVALSGCITRLPSVRIRLHLFGQIFFLRQENYLLLFLVFLCKWNIECRIQRDGILKRTSAQASKPGISFVKCATFLFSFICFFDLHIIWFLLFFHYNCVSIV